MVHSFNSSLEDKSGMILGSDRVIVSPVPIRDTFEQEAKALHLKTLTTLNFLTMGVHGEALSLMDVRAVSPGYPLRGELRTAKDLFSVDERWPFVPERGTIWLESRLFPLLNIKIGDGIEIGRATFKVTRVLTAEPDRTLEGFNLAPWALINTVDVARTEVIQPGSRVTYKLHLAGRDDDLEKLEITLKPQLLAAQTWVDARHARPLINMTVDRINHYLGLVFLVNVGFSGIAILMVLRRFCRRQWDTVAILRCFGVKSGVIVGNYLLAFALLSFMIGMMAIGVSYVLVDRFFHLTTFPTTPILMGFGTLLVLLIGFVLPSILHLNQISPLQVLRRQMQAVKLKVGFEMGIGLVMLGALVFFQVQDIKLSMIFFGMAILLAAAGLIGIFIILKLLAKLSHYSRLTMRLNIRNIASRPYENALQVLAYALVLSFMGVVSFLRFDLISLWQGQIVKDAPNYFAINIPPSELNAFQHWLEVGKIKSAGLYPMLAARLLAVNQEPVAMDDDAHAKRVFPRLLNLTFTQDLSVDNQVIAGHWFDVNDKNKQVVSVEKTFADRLGIQLGDTLQFQIAEEKNTAIVTSIRSVEWNSFSPNFYVIFPAGILEGLPVTYITSFYLPPARIGLLKELVQHFPMVNLVSTEMVITEMRGFFETALKTIEVLWIFTLIISFILLLATITATLDARQNEAVLIRIFGVGNARLREIVLSEFLILGILAGVLAAVSANVAVYWLTEQTFNLPYRFNGMLTVWLPVLGIVVITMGGWIGTRSVLQTPPMCALS
jgi:putative ABC transport system permease protein